MKAAELAATLFLVYVGIVVVFELFGSFYQPTNIRVPLLVITTTAEDGTSNDRILAYLESQDHLFVAASHWPRAWYYRALENPNVQVTLAGRRRTISQDLSAKKNSFASMRMRRPTSPSAFDS